MKRGFVLVEGQTEETFIKQILGPHLRDRGLDLTPVIVSTKRMKSGEKFKGGLVSFEQARNDLRRLLAAKHAVVITTMFDLYGLPEDFPDRDRSPRGKPVDRVTHLESAFKEAIADRRFLPYLSLHEFEALLFSDLAACQRLWGRAAEKLRDVVGRFPSPEDINETPTGAPSKRILKHLRTYQKTVDGAAAAQLVGLGTMRRACTHFDQWVRCLEQIAGG